MSHRNLQEPLPYYKWLWKDWRASRKVQRMSWQARGLCRELLDEFWVEGRIPEDLRELAEICGCSLEEMQRFWPEIEPCWERLQGGGYRNGQLDSVRTESDSRRAALARCGRAGGITKEANASGVEANASDVEANASGSETVASNCHIGRGREEVEEEKEKRKRETGEPAAPDPPSSFSSPDPCKPFAETWNQCRGRLPELKSLTGSRRSRLRKRMSEGLTLETFRNAVLAASATPFCRGENDRGWQVGFDFLIENDSNLLKILEGNYGSLQVAATPSRAPRTANEIYREIA